MLLQCLTLEHDFNFWVKAKAKNSFGCPYQEKIPNPVFSGSQILIRFGIFKCILLEVSHTSILLFINFNHLGVAHLGFLLL